MVSDGFGWFALLVVTTLASNLIHEANGRSKSTLEKLIKNLKKYIKQIM